MFDEIGTNCEALFSHTRFTTTSRNNRWHIIRAKCTSNIRTKCCWLFVTCLIFCLMETMLPKFIVIITSYIFSKFCYLVLVEVLNKKVTYFWLIEKSSDVTIADFFRSLPYESSKALSMSVSNDSIGQFCTIIIAQRSQFFFIKITKRSWNSCCLVNYFPTKYIWTSEVFEVTIRKMRHCVSRMKTGKCRNRISTSRKINSYGSESTFDLIRCSYHEIVSIMRTFSIVSEYVVRIYWYVCLPFCHIEFICKIYKKSIKNPLFIEGLFELELVHVSMHHHIFAEHELHLRNLATLYTDNITSEISYFFTCIQF